MIYLRFLSILKLFCLNKRILGQVNKAQSKVKLDVTDKTSGRPFMGIALALDSVTFTGILLHTLMQEYSISKGNSLSTQLVQLVLIHERKTDFLLLEVMLKIKSEEFCLDPQELIPELETFTTKIEEWRCKSKVPKTLLVWPLIAREVTEWPEAGDSPRLR